MPKSAEEAWILTAVDANLPTRCTRVISAHFGKQSLAGRRAGRRHTLYLRRN